MLGPGQSTLHEVMIYGLQGVQENNTDVYKASFLMNAYKDSGRVNPYLDSVEERIDPTADF